MSSSTLSQAGSICFLLMALAVILGAFGAHGLKGVLSAKYMDIYQTANFYHFVHGLAALLVLAFLPQYTSVAHTYRIVVILWIGLLLFSGSLYFLSFNELWNMPGLRKLGAITPIGGLFFIAAWLYAAWCMFKSTS